MQKTYTCLTSYLLLVAVWPSPGAAAENHPQGHLPEDFKFHYDICWYCSAGFWWSLLTMNLVLLLMNSFEWSGHQDFWKVIRCMSLLDLSKWHRMGVNVFVHQNHGRTFLTPLSNSYISHICLIELWEDVLFMIWSRIRNVGQTFIVHHFSHQSFFTLRSIFRGSEMRPTNPQDRKTAKQLHHTEVLIAFCSSHEQKRLSRSPRTRRLIFLILTSQSQVTEHAPARVQDDHPAFRHSHVMHTRKEHKKPF